MEESLAVESVTVQKLTEMIELSFSLRKEYDRAKKESDKAYADFQAAQVKAAGLMEALGLQKFHSPSGTFTYVYEETYRVPKSPEQREEFFKFLKEKGVYEQMVSVNSQTLNSFAKIEEKNALDEGNFDFKIPGLEKSVPRIKPIMRKN